MLNADVGWRWWVFNAKKGVLNANEGRVLKSNKGVFDTDVSGSAQCH